MNTFYPIYQISIKWCLRQFSRTLLQYYLVNFFYMLLYNLLLFVHSNNTFKKSIVPVTFWCNAFTSTDDLNQNTKCHWIQRERNELRGTSRVWAGGTVYHFIFDLQILFWIKSKPKRDVLYNHEMDVVKITQEQLVSLKWVTDGRNLVIAI